MFSCTQCHHEQLKWSGQCPQCGQWNTLEEKEEIKITGKQKIAGKKSHITPLQPRSTSYNRMSVESAELAAVLGGGLVP